MKGRSRQSRSARAPLAISDPRLPRIHGSNRTGYDRAGGVVRLHPRDSTRDVVDLYNRVRVGTKVTVVR